MESGTCVGVHDDSCLRDRIESEPKPLYERLLNAARDYLREAGIRWHKDSDLEVRGDAVVAHGAPMCGEILVCAVNGDGIDNYL